MSNLLKSKFLFGVVAFAVVAVVAGVLMMTAATSASAAYMHTTLLKQGSTGAQVMELQKTLNMTTCKVAVSGAGSMGNETTTFGGLTKAAVMCFQAMKGLVADGVVGSMTGAALGGVMSGNFPEGCTSAAGYSSTTGTKCDSMPSTGLPAGCSSTTGYSTTTGAKCDGSTGGGSNGPLTGSGAGSIILDSLSKYSDEEVGEGEENVEVLAFTIEAEDDSDVMVTSMKLEFDQATAADSTDLEDYASSVSVWVDGEKVGEADAEDFTEVEATDSWTKSVSIDDVVVEAGEEVEFVIAVTSQNSLDSGDIDTDAWTADILNVRFEDWENVVTTEDTDADALEQDFDFASFASSADINLKISLGDEDVYEAHMLNIDDADTTEGVELHSFMLEAEGDSDILIKDLPVTVNSTETTGNDPDDLISTLYLFIDGEEVASEGLVTSDGDDSTEVVVFEGVDYTLEAGDEVEVVVKADIKATSTTLDDGDTIAVVFGETETDLATFDAEDEEGEELVDGDVNGTATGEAHAVRDVGFALDFVSSSAVISHAGDVGNTNDHDQGTFTIVFDVTAFDGDVFIDETAPDESGSTTESDLTITGTDTFVTSSITSSEAVDVTNSLRVDEGDTDTFTISVVLEAGADGLFKVELADLLWAITDVDGDLNFTYNLDDFETPELYMQYDAA